MSSPPLRTLSDLAVGETAIVRRVRGERRTTVRLLEMGLVPGTRVELRRRAPLGDPLELRVRGYMLSIRNTEALGIEIETASAPAAVAAEHSEDVVADASSRPRRPAPEGAS